MGTILRRLSRIWRGELRCRCFNKKLERFYGDYTEEIKQNLERGTAV